MGYMVRLYRIDNIIGYTGNLNSNPTVYFCDTSTDVNGATKTKRVGRNMQVLFLHGHITQAHDTLTNIGRECVVESWSYSIMNAGPEHDNSGLIGPNQRALQETYHQSEVTPDNRSVFATPDGFSDFHISRSTFNQVGPRDTATLNILARAIARFPRLKAMYGNLADNAYRTL